MRSHETEAWVLDIVDRVRDGRPVEDSRVELKADWPTDPAKAARRLAGHCNAAHGEPVLWVIGIDEKRGVVGASREALPDWLDQVHKQCESIAPELIRDLNIPVGDKIAVTLLFNTDRAPFVVKNPTYGESGGGPIEREVPWREGTAVRTARREDLIRLLSPIQRLPTVEVLDASLELTWFEEGSGFDTPFQWQLKIDLYVVPASGDTLVIPFHKCSARVSVEPHITVVTMQDVALGPRRTRQVIHHSGSTTKVIPSRVLSKTVESSPTEVLLHGAGLVLLTATHESAECELNTVRHVAAYRVSLCPAGADRPIVLAGDLQAPDKELHEGESVAWNSTSSVSADDQPPPAPDNDARGSPDAS